MLKASSFIRDTILDSTQAKMMDLKKSYSKAVSDEGKSHAAD